MTQPNTKEDRNVVMPYAVWQKIKAMIDDARTVREDPQNWPLEPHLMANAIRGFHWRLREIEQSKEFALVAIFEAVADYREGMAKLSSKETPR
jgi:hypothetical protein